MANLVERYIHQVGRYVPQKERAEIQAELRSQIQDQLEDRYGGTPTQADVAAVLAELGDPRRMAASYGSEQYLIGPALYPTMMLVLRRGWVLVPPIIVVLTVLGALIGDEPSDLLGLLIESVFGAVQATLVFTAVVVLIFAILQHSGEDLDALAGREKGFDPLALPEVDDPAAVDRFETAFSIAFGLFSTLVLLYFLYVGGLTLRFDLRNPGEVTPVSIPWLIVLVVASIGTIILQLAALLRNRWSIAMWLASTALDLVVAVGLCFVLWLPILGRMLAAVPELANVPFFRQGPEIVVAASVIIVLASNGGRLVRMLSQRSGDQDWQTGQ